MGMTCDGCKGAITRILNKIDGIDHFEVDVEAKNLRITGTLECAVAAHEKLLKWGSASQKEVIYLGTL